MAKLGFISAMGYVRVGARLVRTPGLRRFVWAPLAINMLVFGVLGWWLYDLSTGWIASWSLFESFGDWKIVRAFATLLKWVFTVVLFFGLAYAFTLLANLVGAPFNGLLAERVEAHLVGNPTEPAPSWITLFKSLPRLLGSEVRKLLYLVVWIVPLLILQFIPLLNIAAPLLIFLFGAWMFALEYFDYPMGNHGLLFKDVRKELRKQRRSALGFGVLVAGLSLVPILNLFIMPVAVAGATAMYVDHFRINQTTP